MKFLSLSALFLVPVLCFPLQSAGQSAAASAHPIVLRAARLLDVKAGRIISPGEVLVQGDHVVEVGTSVKHHADAEVIDLGDRTLLPGLIDAHIHLFLHPGAEDLQTVQESVPERTIMATLAARDDLMAGFTAERDMGTEGAGSADTAVRDAINAGRIPDRGCASAATRSTFSADTRMRSATTLPSMYSRMRTTPTTPTS